MDTWGDQNAIRRRIREIDVQMMADARQAALQGIDRRYEWGELVNERLELARRFVRIRDRDFFTQPWRVTWLSLAMMIVIAMLLYFQGNLWAAIPGFVVGLISGIYFYFIRGRRESRELAFAPVAEFEHVD